MVINPNIVFRKEFDGTGLFYNPDNGQTFYLNPTSRLICECIEKGGEPSIGAEEGARTVAVCDAIIRSSETGMPEKIEF